MAQPTSRAPAPAGELSLDRSGLRPLLQTLGVSYVDAKDKERD